MERWEYTAKQILQVSKLCLYKKKKKNQHLNFGIFYLAQTLVTILSLPSQRFVA